MFNKSNKLGKVLIDKKEGLVEFDCYLLSIWFLEKLKEKKKLEPNKNCMIVEELSDFHKTVRKLLKTKKYDAKIIKYHDKGKIIIDDKEYNVRDFYLYYKYVNNKLESHLLCVKEPYTDILLQSNEEYNCKESIQFRQTTAFINLLDSDAVLLNYGKNLTTIIDKDKAIEIINAWDGMIHDKVPLTDAIEEKNLLRR